MKGKVSIIIPNYNGSRYLKKCLSSVNNQLYKDIELIIIDDGSTDDSVRIIEEFKEEYQNNCIFLQQKNMNSSVARNRGIELANGKYLFFLDSDDELYDQYSISKLVDSIQDADLVITDYQIIGKNIKYEKLYKCKDDLLEFEGNYKYADISPVPSNKLFLKSLVDKYDIFFSNVNIGQDLNFYLKYLSNCNKIKIADFISYKYRIVDSGMTRSHNLNFMSIFDSFKKIQKYYESNGKNLEYSKYITSVAAKHYRQHLSKIKNYSKRYERKMLFSFFDYCIKYNSKICSNKNNFYKKQIKIFYCKRFLLKFRIYDIVMGVIKNDL